MKITVESTSKIVSVNGIDCRIWEGETERGIAVHCFITRIAAKADQDLAEFEAELRETRAPSAEAAAIPPRMIL